MGNQKPNSNKISKLERELKELLKIRKDVGEIEKYVNEKIEKTPEYFKEVFKKVMEKFPEKERENYLVDMFDSLYLVPVSLEINKYQNQ